MDYIYQTQSFESGDHILVFDDEGKYVRKIFVPNSEFRPFAYVWVLDANFRTLFQANSHVVMKWLEENPDAERAIQVGIGRDFQMLSIGEFKSLYG